MDLTLSDKDIEERYMLRGRMEILSVFNDLIRNRTPVTVYFNQGKDFLLTTLLEARVSHLVFDVGSDQRTNRLLQGIPEALCVAVLAGVRVQFSVNAPERFSWGDMDAFRSALPAKVMRLQRRETHRVTLPIGKPSMMQVRIPKTSATVEFVLHDMSVEGAGITVVGEPAFALGDHLPVSFAISKTTRVACTGVVRHITPLGERRRGEKHHRVGFWFKDMPGHLQAAIQRYLIDIELQQKALVAH